MAVGETIGGGAHARGRAREAAGRPGARLGGALALAPIVWVLLTLLPLH